MEIINILLIHVLLLLIFLKIMRLNRARHPASTMLTKYKIINKNHVFHP